MSSQTSWPLFSLKMEYDNKLKFLFYAVTKMTFRTKEKLFHLFHSQHSILLNAKTMTLQPIYWLHFHLVYKMNNFPLYFYESATKNYYHNVSVNKNTLYTLLFYSSVLVMYDLGHYYSVRFSEEYSNISTHLYAIVQLQ